MSQDKIETLIYKIFKFANKHDINIIKKYIKFLMKSNNNIVNPLSNDFTKINLVTDSNDIQFNLPITKDNIENNE